MPKLLRNQVFLCCLLFAVCVVASVPVAETGMHDDWSYVRTAQVLANTGHLVFNGWGAPMLGIQLLPAALLIKVFGFSFTIARLTTVLISVVTIALLQPTLVRCGLREWNASIATITLMLSPMVLPVATGFLSDVWCLLAIVLCLYCCLRALATKTDRAAAAWLCTAALGNAAFGTSRQIAWLGLLVMVPCCTWLLRRRRRVVILSAVAFVVSFAFIVFMTALFNRQAYILPEEFTLRNLGSGLARPVENVLRPILQLALLVLPVLLMFLLAVSRSSRKGRWFAGAALAFFLVVLGIDQHLGGTLMRIPFTIQKGSSFGPRGVYQVWPIWGSRPAVLPDWVRDGIAGLTILSLLAWISLSIGVPRSNRLEGDSDPGSRIISLRDLRTLLGPFTLSYIIFLLPRDLRDALIDRYLIPVVMVALIFLVREYQERIQARLPVASLVFALLVAVYSVLTLQDAFAAYRAVLRAANEVIAAGVPRKQIDGGWEYDGLTQIDLGGYVHQTGIHVPKPPLLYGHRRTGPCEIAIDVWIPDVEPAYALSYNRNGCGGATAFAPVRYWRLLWPHEMTVYVVKSPDLSGKHGLFPSFPGMAE